MARRKSAGALVDHGYFDLVRRFPLKPLRHENDFKAATTMMNALVDRGIDDLTDGEEAYLDVLSDLVKKYEDEHQAIPDASAVDVLEFLIEDRETNQRTVALGSGIAVSTMSELLSGQRTLNLDHMRKLAAFFKVDPAVFLPREKPSPTKKPATKR